MNWTFIVGGLVRPKGKEWARPIRWADARVEWPTAEWRGLVRPPE